VTAAQKPPAVPVDAGPDDRWLTALVADRED
jgi:hypothetical protein